MENNKKTYENRSKNSFRKSFFVHHQAAWGLLHPTSGCSTMARRCFNAASGKRQEVCCSISMKYCSMNFVIVSMPQAARGLLQLLDYYTVRTDLWEFQCRKRQEVCCNNTVSYLVVRAIRFNAASGKRSVATAWLLHGKDGFMGVSMPQAARGLLQLVTLSPVAAAAGQVSMPQAARGLLQQW